MAPLLPRIGVTMGDAAGIGPEIIIKSLSDPKILDICNPVVIGDYRILSETGREFSLGQDIVRINSPDDNGYENAIKVLSLSRLENIRRGVLSEEAGRASGQYIEKGVELALGGSVDALVTSPISKESFNMGGYHYPGHTEFLANLTGTTDYAMMLMGESLRVVLLTTHCPLMEVTRNLNIEDTLRIVRLTDRSLGEYFGIEKPRLALVSLNPHAGEGGLFGIEERNILIPAAQAARDEGMDIAGPLPSDTLFHKAVKGDYDAVICPYHDQGLIPLKLLHFDDGVNVTLGLPIIRTSPDHGTAFDIAGRGIANPESMKAAVRTAVDMVRAKRR